MPTKNDKFDVDPALVRKLAKLLKDTGLGEIEYAEGERKIRVASPRSAAAYAPAASSESADAGSSAAETVPNGKHITAPMVGTVYLAPSPDAEPFVKPGDKVKPGDTLLIIEAMKVMNPIKATAAGTIAEILVTGGKPVEFGEALIVMG